MKKKTPVTKKHKPPEQRWLVTHRHTGEVLGTVRAQFAFGARHKVGPELHVDMDVADVAKVGEAPEGLAELAASMGLRVHADALVAEVKS